MCFIFPFMHFSMYTLDFFLKTSFFPFWQYSAIKKSLARRIEGPKIEKIFRNLQSEFLFCWISPLSLFSFCEHIYINLYL